MFSKHLAIHTLQFAYFDKVFKTVMFKIYKTPKVYLQANIAQVSTKGFSEIGSRIFYSRRKICRLGKSLIFELHHELKGKNTSGRLFSLQLELIQRCINCSFPPGEKIQSRSCTP